MLETKPLAHWLWIGSFVNRSIWFSNEMWKKKKKEKNMGFGQRLGMPPENQQLNGHMDTNPENWKKINK